MEEEKEEERPTVGRTGLAPTEMLYGQMRRVRWRLHKFIAIAFWQHSGVCASCQLAVATTARGFVCTGPAGS